MTQVIINDILPYTQAVAILNQTVFSTTWTANYATDVVVYQTPYGSGPNDITQILTTSQYSIAFIGDSLTVQVTLVTGAGAGDLITITRQTPADRENLYTNTNFTPSMLNNDFGILTLVDQQNQLVNQQIAPRYNYSALINQNNLAEDTILPILPANSGWVKNNANTAILPYTFPNGGVAPAIDTYVLLTPDITNLPNSFALSSLDIGFIVWDGTELINTAFAGVTNQISIANATGIGGATTIGIASNPILPGTSGMGIPSGTTAQRVVPSSNIGLRYNSDTRSLEYWNGVSWIQVSDSSGPLNWQTVTVASINAQIQNGYVTNRSATPVQIELPITFSVGDTIEVLGLGAGGWSLVAGAGTTIKFGSVATSIAGAINSDITNANIIVKGLVANTTWTITLTNSNPTYI